MKKVRMQQKYDTEANWLAGDPVLLSGEIAFSVDITPVSFKIGNGIATWTALPYFSADVRYTNINPTTLAVGGITVGSYFSNQTMGEMWDSLLYANQYPIFLTFDNNEIDAMYEVGYTIPIGSKTFTWTSINPLLITPNSIEISGPGFTTVTGLADDSSESVNFTSTIQHIIPGSSMWTIQGENLNTLATFNRTKITSWRWRAFWGISENTSLIEAEIEALHSNQLRSDFVDTFSFNATGYKYFCYPVSFGVATQFTDVLTSLNVAMNPYNIVSITNPYGQTINYNVHRTTNKLGSAIDIIVS